MEIKETANLWVLRASQKLRIPDVRHVAAKYAMKILAEIETSGLSVKGPWLFVSRNLPKNGNTFFDWEICCPIERPENYRGKLEIAHLEPVMVASTIHHGSLRTLFTKGYAPLVAELDMSRYIYSGESREIYHGWNGHGACYQNIEIQFVLAR